MDSIMLSIVVITYNHEKYVRGCIESILQQDVQFKYEILIGDDSSTDNTVKIIREIMIEHPGVIKLILHEKNVGAARNIYDLFVISMGKYITRLEGDDYWEKTDQLQYSIDFLEKNQNYIGITRSTKSIDEKGNIHNQVKMKFRDNVATFKDFLYSKQSGTPLFRNFFLNNEEDFSIIYTAQRMVAELIIGYLILKRGDLYVTNEKWEIKRAVRNLDASNYNSLRNLYQIFEDIMEAWDNLAVYSKKYNFARNRVAPTVNLIFYCVSIKDYKYIKKAMSRLPFKGKILTIIKVIKIGIRKIFKKIFK